MFYVVCYDIVDDGLRQQLSNKLLGYGTRIQDSVFECLLDEELYGRLLEDLDKVGLADADRVRIYKMCSRCLDAVQIYGTGEVTRDPEYYLV
jgi:CRISPR-associated protein Cas2